MPSTSQSAVFNDVSIACQGIHRITTALENELEKLRSSAGKCNVDVLLDLADQLQYRVVHLKDNTVSKSQTGKRALSLLDLK